MPKRHTECWVAALCIFAASLSTMNHARLPAQEPTQQQNTPATKAPAGSTAAVKPDERPRPSDPLIDVQRGTLAIVITAPHGGLEDVPGVPLRVNRNAYRFVTGNDANTRLLAHELAKDIEKRLGGKPYYVTARFHRKYIDANREAAHAYESPAAKPYYDGYHDTIAEFCREVLAKHGSGLLIDVHGQAVYKDEILVGTIGGETVPLLRQRFGVEALVGKTGMVGCLQAAHLKTMPALDATDLNVPRFNGGFTVQNYGSHKPGGLDAIQFEYGSHYRALDQIGTTARKSAEGVERFYLRYMVRR
ncbi:MAG: hypothetical protein K8U03_04460 [Planctomycetia bacterium]|nr:hypothetical protein [Planctomycetia bacterium]